MEIYKNVKFHITIGILFVLFIVLLGVGAQIITLAGGLVLGGIVLLLAAGIYIVSGKIPVHDEDTRYNKDTSEYKEKDKK